MPADMEIYIFIRLFRIFRDVRINEVRQIRKIRKYLDTHFKAYFILMLLLAILAFMLIFQSYLKKEYLQYLMDQSYSTEKEIIGSLRENVDFLLHELIGESSEIATDADIYELALAADQENSAVIRTSQYYQLLYGSFLNYNYMQMVDAVAIVGKNGLVCQYDRFRKSAGALWNGTHRQDVEELANTLLKVPDTGKFPRYQAFTEPEVYYNSPDRRIFHIAYPLTGGKVSIWKTQYVLVVTYSMDIFEDFLKAAGVSEGEIWGFVADGDGKVIYHEDEDCIGMTAEQLLSDTVGSHLTEEIGYFGWNINIVIDETGMRARVDEVYQRGILVYVLLLAVYALVLIRIFSKLFAPVERVKNSLLEAESGNYNTRIRIDGAHEIWQLAGEFNRMMDSIQEKEQLIEQQHKEKLISVEQQHQAEREALESQINAHFICNTLGCINYEAIEGGNYQVSILIKKLSNILRYTFDQKCQSVYMYQELLWIDQYLYLQKTRFETTFDYEVSVPEKFGQWPCCKLMFQPFVENSILHGFEGRESGGLLRITGEAEGERLRIVIEDNGCGMSAEKEAAIRNILTGRTALTLENREKLGIGIRNVVTRMRMYYGKNLDIDISTKEGEGTAFTFWIPIPESYSEEENDNEDYYC